MIEIATKLMIFWEGRMGFEDMFPYSGGTGSAPPPPKKRG
jgi:hypothetical protein